MQFKFIRCAVIVAMAFSYLTGASGTSSAQGAQATRQRPNILFIFSDDQSPRTVGCYPQSWKWVRTPNMDRLAKAGIRFTHCYLGSWCMPSRANLLTGHYPHAIQSMRMEGTYPGCTYDPEQCQFWPKIFRKQGYHTAQIGKWHTGTDVGYARDWDHQIVWNRPKNPANAGSYYAEQIIEWNGKEQTVTGYATDNYTKWACDYINGEGRDKAKPWFLWLCYGAIHGPSTPAPRHKGTLKDAPVEAPTDIFPPRPEKPAYLNRSQAWRKGPTGEPIAGASGEAFGDESGKTSRSYADFVRQVNECAMALDEGIGKVLDALKASGQAENTLVIWTADQGFGMGEHGFRSKLAPYDSTYNSPLVISFAGQLPEGKVCKSPVCAGDITATIFAFAGLEQPWKFHGRDLTPVLKNSEVAEAPRAMLFEHMGHYYGKDTAPIPTDEHIYHNNVPRWIAIRYGKYKYIRTLIEGEMEEIYDLEADPEELTNLALKPEHQALLKDLREKAIVELRRSDAPFADGMPRTKQMGG